MPFLTFLLIYVATFLISELLRPKPKVEDAKPAGLGDFNVPTATEGRVVPIIWGRVKLSGPNIVWYGDLQAIPQTQTVKSGIFSESTVIVGFFYKIGLQFALCRGPMDSNTDKLFNIRVDENYAWGEDASTMDTPIGPFDPQGATGFIDQQEYFGGLDSGGGGGLFGQFRLHPGTQTQDVSAYLTPFQTPQPAYRGTVYLTWNTGFIGLTPQLRPFEFELSRYPNGLGLSATNRIVVDGANPMNVIYEALTNSEWGLNISPTLINVSNLQAIAVTLKTEGHGFAWIWDRTLDVLEVLRTVEEQIDGILFQDPSTGLYDFRLIRFDYTPGTLPVLDESNVQSLNRFQRPSWANTTNVISVEFNERTQNYKLTFALAQDSANIEIVQKTNTAKMKFPGVKNKTLANSLAWRELRNQSYPLATGQLVADRTQWDVVPGDVRELTWGRLGITLLPVRIIKVDRGRILENQIKLDFTEDIFGFAPGSFADPIDTSWQPPNDNAFLPFAQLLIEVPYRLTDADSTGINTENLQIGTIAVRNGGFHVGYNIYATTADLPGTAVDPTESDTFPPGGASAFSPFGQLTAALDRGETNGFQDAVGFTVDAGIDLDLVGDATAAQLEQGQNILLIDDEIMLFSTIVDNMNGTWTISNLIRGALDTVPADHVDNSQVFIFSYGIGLVNSTPFLDTTQNIQAKIQTFTPFNTFPFGTLVADSLDTDQRSEKAYPPRDVELNAGTPGGGVFPISGGSPSGANVVGVFTVTWAGSDKFTQAFATAWDDANVAQEASTTWRLRIIEDPAGAATVVVDDSSIVIGPGPGSVVKSGFADDTVSDTYRAELSSIKAGGESQVWEVLTLAGAEVTIYGYGYKYGEKYGGDIDGTP